MARRLSTNRPRRAIATFLCLLLVTLLTPASVASQGAASRTLVLAEHERVFLQPPADFPWLSLRPGRQLRLEGADGLQTLALYGGITPLSLASADFDEDGMPDLVCGYDGPAGAILSLLRGNVDAVYPNSSGAKARRASGQLSSQPFHGNPSIVALPSPPDFLLSGDFNADGHIDVLLATAGLSELFLLPGKGDGSFGAPEIRGLPGQVEAMISVDLNRPDGLADIAVGLRVDAGSEVHVLEAPNGAFRAVAEVFPFAGKVNALAAGQLNESYHIDLAVASDERVVLIPGRDRRLSVRLPGEPPVPSGPVDERSMPSTVVALAAGDFSGDSEKELATMTRDGHVYLVDFEQARFGLSSGPWRSIPSMIPVTGQSAGPDAGPSRPKLLPVRLATFPKQEIVVLDGQQRQLYILMEPSAASLPAGQMQPLSIQLALQTQGVPIDALPMRLGGDALSDLVLLITGNSAPIVAQTEPNHTFTVNVDGDSGDTTPGDGLCDSNNNTPGEQCTFNAAIEEANQSPGLDKIDFAIIEISQGGQPIITGPLFIDGTSVGRVKFSRSLTLTLGGNTVRGLAVADFDGGGGPIHSLRDGAGSIFEDNYYGANLEGTAKIVGISLRLEDTSDNLIGGTVPEARNLIVTSQSFEIRRGTGNNVQGNFIGTDATGTQVIDTDLIAGLIIRDSSLNTVGGLAEGSRNIFGSHTRADIDVRDGSTGNLIQGNHLGVDISGKVGLGVGNTSDGVVIQNNSSENTVGGTILAARNVISSHTSEGVDISFNSSLNTVQGNVIGTDDSGTAAIDNRRYGVVVSAPDNFIGGTAAGAGNVISGNGTAGIRLSFSSGSPADGTRILGNLIGTDASGDSVLGNGLLGITATGDGIVIGAVGAGNVIAGNGDGGFNSYGISFAGSNSFIQGNFIGTNASGAPDLGNTGPGLLTNGDNNLVGGTEAGQGNVITRNGSHGIRLNSAAQGVAVLGNSIFSNDAEGFKHFGGNNQQAAPVITGVTDTSVSGTLTSTADTEFRVEFFSNTECDPSGFGEGETFIAAINVTTGGDGVASFSTNFGPESGSVTATATDPDNNTSEFSNCEALPQDLIEIVAILPSPDAGFPPVNPDQTVVFSNVKVAYTLHSDLTGELVLRAFADLDETKILGEVSQAVTVTPEHMEGDFTFAQLTAGNVTPQVTAISVIAYLKPTNAPGFTVVSEPAVFILDDAVVFDAMLPNPALPLTAKESVSFLAEIDYRLASAPQGTLEMQIRDSDGDLLVEPPFEFVDFGQSTRQLGATIDIPDDSNTITVDALLVSGSGTETITDPSVSYGVNRIRFDSLDPLPAMFLEAGVEQTFTAQLDFNIATDTSEGTIQLEVRDEAGEILQHIGTTGDDLLENLPSGPGNATLQVRVLLPETPSQITLGAILADGSGGLSELARDETVYRFFLEGSVWILASDGVEVPLFRARVKAAPTGEGESREVYTDSDGVYRMPLTPGTYDFRAEPPEEDEAIRKIREFTYTVAEDATSLPDIKIGTFNRRNDLINLGSDLDKIGTNTNIVLIVQALSGLLVDKPYSDEVIALTSFANSQPSAPEPTEEGLYRLSLATRTTKGMSDDASELLKDFSTFLVDWMVGLTSLSSLDAKIKEVFDKLISKLSQFRIVDAIIRLESVQVMTGEIHKTSSSLANSLRNTFLNVLRSSLLGPRSAVSPRVRKAFEGLTAHFLLGSGAGSFLKPGDAVKKQLTNLLQEALIGFYGDMTDESLASGIAAAQSFDPQDDQLRAHQDAVDILTAASRARTVAVQNSVKVGGLGIASDLAASLKGGIDVISIALTPFLGFPPTAPVVVPLIVVFNRVSTFLKYLDTGIKIVHFVDVGVRVYGQLPEELDTAVGHAFGETAAPESEGLLLLMAADDTIPRVSLAPEERLALATASIAFQAALDETARLVRENRFQELIDQIPFLLAADGEFDKRLGTTVGPLLGAIPETLEKNPDSRGSFDTVIESTVSSTFERLGLYFNILAFVFEATEISSFNDPDYLARKEELIAALVSAKQNTGALETAVEEASQVVDQEGTGLVTAVIETASVTSGGEEITSFATVPQTVEVHATIANVSDQAVSGLVAAIPSVDEALGLTFQSSRQLNLAPLNPGERVQVSWQMTFAPSALPEAVPIYVQLETPNEDVFVPGSFRLALPVALSTDTDEDGMPDLYEHTFGLDANKVDAGEDADNDNLINFSEYLIGTTPNEPDTDGDESLDGAEVEAGSDPLDADSTPETVEREVGDVTKDKEINVEDVIFLLRFLSGEGPEPFPLSLGDVNEDGFVDIRDVTLLLSEIVSDQ